MANFGHILHFKVSKIIFRVIISEIVYLGGLKKLDFCMIKGSIYQIRDIFRIICIFK